jgi:molybdate transport system substrate-binding protein
MHAMRARFLPAAFISLFLSATAIADTVRLAVAISLKEAVTEIARTYEAKTGEKIELSFGASGQLATQIKSGAPIDVFISAAQKQVDDLNAGGLIDAESQRVIAGNTLVLIVPAESKISLNSFEKLGTAPIKRLAIGEPRSVPAGQYAMQTLRKLKLTDALAGKLEYGANVRQVLDYVIRGEVSAGIVYATDAKEGGDKVKVIATAKEDSHDPIVYPAVVMKKSANAAAAKKFLDHLGSDEARRVLESRGFTVPKKADAAGGKP